MKPLLHQVLPFLFASMRRLENASPTPTPPSGGQQVTTTQQPPYLSDRTVYEVCTSPACVADGAYAALERLRALAPPHVVIQPGSCSSLCGNGPVVLQNPPTGGTTVERQNNQNIVRHRKVAGSKVLELLYPALLEGTPPEDEIDQEEEEEEPIQPLNDVQVMLRERRRRSDYSGKTKRTTKAHPPKPSFSRPPVELVQGYNLVLDADAAFAQADYETAVALYGQAVELAFATAVDWQRQRERLEHRRGSVSSSSSSTLTPPVHLEWLIRARRNDAKCKLELGYNIRDALFEAQAACNLSKNTCAESFQVLADIYRAMSDLAGEKQALTRVLELPAVVPKDKSAVVIQNERRELKFRLDKIQRELVSRSAVNMADAMSAQEGLEKDDEAQAEAKDIYVEEKD